MVSSCFIHYYNKHVSKKLVIRGGSRISSQGGAYLKILRRAEGGANIFGVFRVKNHDFTPKKSYFLQFQGGLRVPPPLDPPLIQSIYKPMMTANQASIYLSFCDLTLFATSGLQSHVAHCCSHYSNVAEQHLLRFNRCV